MSHLLLPPGRADQINTTDRWVRWLAVFVDATLGDLIAQIEVWKADAKQAPGGAPEKFSTRALVIAMADNALRHEPFLATEWRDTMFVRFSAAMRAELGIPEIDTDDEDWEDREEHNVLTRFHRAFDPIEPSPLPHNHRLGPVEFEARTKDMTEAERAERERRLTWVVSRLFEALWRLVPEEAKAAYGKYTTVDATPIPLYARPERRRPGRDWATSPMEKSSTEPEGGWYARSTDDRDDNGAPLASARPGGSKDKLVWAFEATVLLAVPDPKVSRGLPCLPIAIAPLHRPGADPGGNAVRAMIAARDTGHPLGLTGADRAYSNAKPENYQLPARALGSQPVFDYRDDQLGEQGSYAGAIQVEGCFHCPMMDRSLIEATKDFRGDKISEATYQARIERRQKYRLRAKERPDPEGHVRLMCPAAGPKPLVRCEMKHDPNDDRLPPGMTEVKITSRRLKENPPPICKQQSVTFPPEAGAKFAQPLYYGSPEWKATYAHLRNAMEGNNGHVKDEAKEALGDPLRRRLRGIAAQSLATAFAHFSCAFRKLRHEFRKAAHREAQEHHEADEATRRRRRRTRPLADFAPAVTSVPNADLPSLDTS